jgi:glycosyltransferase involved in cell wall biosynthesis
LAAHDFVVGIVGRFCEEKNPQLIVEAVAQLPRRYKALYIGHGYMRSELVEQCLAMLLGRFVLLEGDGDLGDLYATMD